MSENREAEAAAVARLAVMAADEVLSLDSSAKYVRDAAGRLQIVRGDLREGMRSLAFQRLTAFADYVSSDHDAGVRGEQRTAVVVESPSRVVLAGEVREFDNRRDVLASCEYPSTGGLTFGQWLDVETLNIQLRVHCLQDEARDGLISTISSTVATDSVEQTDDGLSQSVVVKRGVVSRKREAIQDVVWLRPRWTFPEVDQPTVPFVVRLRQGPDGVAFRLDPIISHQWVIDACERLATWLRDHGCPTVYG